MKVSPFVGRACAAVGIVGLLALVRLKPWASHEIGTPAAQRETLTVGFLPVT